MRLWGPYRCKNMKEEHGLSTEHSIYKLQLQERDNCLCIVKSVVQLWQLHGGIDRYHTYDFILNHASSTTIVLLAAYAFTVTNYIFDTWQYISFLYLGQALMLHYVLCFVLFCKVYNFLWSIYTMYIPNIWKPKQLVVSPKIL